jgi:hypothetical protein
VNSAFLWILLISFSLLSAAGFGYIYHKDKDKRKLMFAFALVFASISYLPQIQLGLENTETLRLSMIQLITLTI